MTTPIHFETSEKFDQAVKAARDSAAEQILIERTIGRAVLAGLGGKYTDLSHAYAAIGGADPAAKLMFEGMNPSFAKLKLDNVKTAAVAAANRGAVAASKSSSVRSGNPVFNVQNTALHTLAELGGADFKAKFKVD
jgi:hypothetical protein